MLLHSNDFEQHKYGLISEDPWPLEDLIFPNEFDHNQVIAGPAYPPGDTVYFRNRGRLN